MTKADEEAIREIELRFNEAWGRHDADGMVESLADDAQFVTVNGAWAKTRADYLDLMRRLQRPRRTVPNEHPRDAGDASVLSRAGRRHDAFAVPYLRRH
jgi:uncharacterized protein (TIGR02246 family)